MTKLHFFWKLVNHKIRVQKQITINNLFCLYSIKKGNWWRANGTRFLREVIGN